MLVGSEKEVGNGQGDVHSQSGLANLAPAAHGQAAPQMWKPVQGPEAAAKVSVVGTKGGALQ
jgi:hypothetical protein